MQIRHYVLIISVIIIFGMCNGSAAAGEFYLHEDNQYWWYYSDNPHFYAVVPNNAERYVSKTIFGYEFLEMSWDGGSVIMEIGSMVGNNTDTIIDFVAKRWSALLDDQLVFANWEITTSNKLKTYFYALEGVGPDGQKSMLRSVYFHHDNTVVYLAMYLPSSKYQGTIKNHWLRAVNEFEW